jgi:hypothetical protein
MDQYEYLFKQYNSGDTTNYLFNEELNKLGKEGWMVYMTNNLFKGKTWEVIDFYLMRKKSTACTFILKGEYFNQFK